MAELLVTSSRHARGDATEGEGTTASIYGHNLGAAVDRWFPYYIMLKSGDRVAGGGGGVSRGPAALQLISARIFTTQPNMAPSLLQVSICVTLTSSVCLESHIQYVI